MEGFVVVDYLHGGIEYFIREEFRVGFLSGAFKKGEEPDVFFCGKPDCNAVDFFVCLVRTTDFSFPG